LLELEPYFTGNFATIRRGPKRKPFRDVNRNRSFSPLIRTDQCLAIQLRLMWRGSTYRKFAARKTRIFVQLQTLIVLLRSLRIEYKNPKRMTRPTVISQGSFEVWLLYARLLVDRNHGPRLVLRCVGQSRVVALCSALHGVAQRCSRQP